MNPRLVRFAAFAAALFVLGAKSWATWSIVVVDTKTGEVCVAGATCLGGDLTTILPVVIPGRAVAAAQANIDGTGQNKQTIYDAFQAGLSPREVLEVLSQTDAAHYGRQYGLVDLTHEPITYSGSGAGFAKPNVTGVVGEWRYAMQGNVLACDEVILQAEQAFRATEGDLSQRVMAAMAKAREFGGDGRCSCSFANPTGCGCPPQTGKRTCGTAFIVVARLGDAPGVCSPRTGCANGSYFLRLAEYGPPFNADCVRRLEDAYDVWRVGMRGLVDQVHSRVVQSSQRLRTNAKDPLRVTLELADIERTPIAHGGHGVRLVFIGAGAPVATPGPIVDRGDGTYEIAFSAGATPGTDRWQVWVDEASKSVALEPPVQFEVLAPR